MKSSRINHRSITETDLSPSNKYSVMLSLRQVTIFYVWYLNSWGKNRHFLTVAMGQQCKQTYKTFSGMSMNWWFLLGVHSIISHQSRPLAWHACIKHDVSWFCVVCDPASCHQVQFPSWTNMTWRLNLRRDVNRQAGIYEVHKAPIWEFCQPLSVLNTRLGSSWSELRLARDPVSTANVMG